MQRHVRPRQTSLRHAEQRVLNSGLASMRVRIPSDTIVIPAATAANQLGY